MIHFKLTRIRLIQASGLFNLSIFIYQVQIDNISVVSEGLYRLNFKVERRRKAAACSIGVDAVVASAIDSETILGIT